MNAQQLTESLDAVDRQYYETEERTVAIDGYRELHRQVLGDDALLAQFEREVLGRAGGEYIPYVFWRALARFLGSGEGREQLFDIVRAFAESDFSEELKAELKPLLVVYLAHEKQFDIDRMMSFIVEKAHPQVKEYFDKLIAFVPKNLNAVQTYRKKFDLLRTEFPDFDRFNLPLPRLQEELA